MSQANTPEYLFEKALRALLQQYVTPGYISNWYLSDSNAERVRPCISIICSKCIEQSLGQGQTQQWQTGVFRAEAEIALEEKAYQTTPEQMSQAWSEVRAPFYQNKPLAGEAGLLTTAIPEPFHVHYAFLKGSNQVVIPEFQVSRKTLTFEAVFMTAIDPSS
jgi:hypothetical protein